MRKRSPKKLMEIHKASGKSSSYFKNEDILIEDRWEDTHYVSSHY